MPKPMQTRIHEVLSQVMGVPLSTVSDESSPDNTEGWDSVRHLNLVVAVESEFDVSLSPEDAMEMRSVRLIRLLLEEKGVG